MYLLNGVINSRDRAGNLD